MRLKTKKIDEPNINKPVRLTRGLTLLNCYGPFYLSNINFRENISKFKTCDVNFKYLHKLFPNLKIGYIVVEGTHVPCNR